MKIIKYKLHSQVNKGSNAVPIWVDIFNNVKLTCSDDELEKCLAVVVKEAYNGEYTIEDDNTVPTPTQLDKIEAQVTYTAMMTNTLLEG